MGTNSTTTTIINYTLPEPPPVKGRGIEVLPTLIALLNREFIKEAGCNLLEIKRLLVARAKFGKKKYKTYLKTNNGRNPLNDAVQEGADKMMYLCQEMLEAEEIGDYISVSLIQDDMRALTKIVSNAITRNKLKQQLKAKPINILFLLFIYFIQHILRGYFNGNNGN